MNRKSIVLSGLFIIFIIFILYLDKNDIRPIHRIGKRPDKPDQAAAWFYNQRAKPNGIPADALFKAKEYVKNKMPQNAQLFTKNILGWQSLGPGNIGGRVRTIVVHPTNQKIIYTAGVAGGIWKTNDGGNSWTPLDDFMANLAVCTMVMDPNNSEILYAGTGEGFFNIDAVPGAGIFKTTNGGLTWIQLPTTANNNFNYVNKLAYHPFSSDTLLAATRSGLWRTIDGGANWSQVESGAANKGVRALDVLFNPVNPAIAIAAFGSVFSNDGIYRSVNGGETWNKITSNLPTIHGRISLAISPSFPQVVYASIANVTDNSLLGLYKSKDGGVNWELINDASVVDYLSYGNNGSSGQGWYDHIIKVHPTDTNTVFAGGIDLYKSTNGGISFSEISHWYGGYGLPYVHADQHEIIFMPNAPDTIWVGNDGGIFKTTDGGTNWDAFNNNLEITQFYSGAAVPNADIVYGGTQDNGTLKLTGFGPNWNEIYGGDGGFTAVNYQNHNIIYTEYTNLEIMKSTSSGAPFTWFTATNGIGETERRNRALFIAPFIMDPNNPDVLYAGTHRLYRTSDGAANWTPISDDLTNGESISAIAASKSSNQAIYTGSSDGKVFRSFNSGTNWVDISSGLPANRWVTRIAVNPDNHLKVYVSYSGYNTGEHIFRSEDGGDNWTNISNNLPDIPVNTIVVNLLNTNILYVGTDLGVYESTNDGASWSSANTGLANVVVQELFLKQHDQIDYNLVAATHGRGMFITTSVVVPVELSLFTADIQENKVVLNWRTESELNSSHFEIERRSAAGEFQTLATIKSAGTTTVPQNYNYTDNTILIEDALFYRLKQVDTGGKVHYSNELKVEVEVQLPNYILWPNYPNPFSARTIICYQIPRMERVTIKIYDILGREVKTLFDQYQQSGIYHIPFNANALRSGIYFYRVKAGSFSKTRKLILL